ncbi:MAG: XRE family transcriptional regulator [Desulfovibrio sp.]
MPINKDIYTRIKAVVDHFAKGVSSNFAKQLGIPHNTFQGYLSSTGQDKIKVKLLFQILDICPGINPHWMLTGEGEMLGRSGMSTHSGIPPEELDEKLTPTQREMLTYKRLQTELGRSPERIADGIDAIVMGKTRSPKSTYPTAKPEAAPGYNNIHEPGVDFGENI